MIMVFMVNAGELAIGCSETEKHRIVVVNEFRDRSLMPNFGVQVQGETGLLENFEAM